MKLCELIWNNYRYFVLRPKITSPRSLIALTLYYRFSSMKNMHRSHRSYDGLFYTKQMLVTSSRKFRQQQIWTKIQHSTHETYNFGWIAIIVLWMCYILPFIRLFRNCKCCFSLFTRHVDVLYTLKYFDIAISWNGISYFSFSSFFILIFRLHIRSSLIFAFLVRLFISVAMAFILLFQLILNVAIERSLKSVSAQPIIIHRLSVVLDEWFWRATKNLLLIYAGNCVQFYACDHIGVALLHFDGKITVNLSVITVSWWTADQFVGGPRITNLKMQTAQFFQLGYSRLTWVAYNHQP